MLYHFPIPAILPFERSQLIMTDYFDFTGKVALVVGVGGIGRAQALGFAERGADIVAADNRPETAAAVADEARALGRKALAITVDVTDEASVQAMLASTMKEFPRIDILVNTAGLNLRRPQSDDFPIDDWQKMMDVNVRGTWLCCQVVGRQMVKQGGGRIINISSIASYYGARGGGVAYGPSKAAVNMLTRTLACEWAQHNVLVNALAPTVIETPFMGGHLSKPEVAEMLQKRIPMGRWGQPEDVVGPTLFLASEAANFITGDVIIIDGGLSTQIY
jgi:gluconate 5-dehydrogenase